MPFATDPRHRAARRPLAACFAAVLVLAGCRGADAVKPFEPVTDPEQLYLSLTLNHRAINLSTSAPYDTIRLTATPRNALGDPLSGLPAPTFRSNDTTAVVVSADGVVQVRQPGQGTLVIAELRSETNIRHADTAIVNVTSDPVPPVLQDFSIQPVSPEDATRALRPSEGAVFLGFFLLEPIGIPVLPPIMARATDAAGADLPALAVHYQSRDPDLLQIDPRTGAIKTVRTGQAMVVASTFAYGVAKVDSALYAVTVPFYQVIGFVESDVDGTLGVVPQDVQLRPNGFVFWLNASEQPVDVVIEGPGPAEEATVVCNAYGPGFCGSGNIDAFSDPNNPFASIRVRQLPTPGVYTYRSPLTGLSGRIVVVDQPGIAAHEAPAP